MRTTTEFILAYYELPAERPHSFEPMPGFPYDCNICKLHRGLSPELCDQSRKYRTDFYPALANGRVTDWHEKPLGAIESARVYRHNFGGRFIAITAKIDGKLYSGRASYDNGNAIMLRERRP